MGDVLEDGIASKSVYCSDLRTRPISRRSRRMTSGWIAATLAVTARATVVIVSLGTLLLVLYLGATLAFPKRDGQIVVGDAKHHFVQLRSAVFDRDLDFQNEYMATYGITRQSIGAEWLFSDLTPTGHVRNYMPVGPAVLWAPLYLVVVAGQLVGTWLLGWPPPNGYERILQLVPGIMGVASATASAWLGWRLARRFTGESLALAAAVAVWFGTHVLYYALVSPAYSHAASMLTAAGLFTYWLQPEATPSLRRSALLGALAGCCALMRWQDALFIAVPMWDAMRARACWGRRAGMAGVAIVGWLLAFLPQMVVWQVLYGRALAIPQGPSFMQWTSPHLVDVLFSANHGLFTWAPLLVLAVGGLVTFARRHMAWAPCIAVILLGSWYVNAAVADWWAGEAFGARRFASLSPLFMLGLAVWLQDAIRSRLRLGARLAIVGGLVLANGLLLLQYQLCLKGFEAIAPYPDGVFDMFVARFLVPIRLLRWWM